MAAIVVAANMHGVRHGKGIKKTAIQDQNNVESNYFLRSRKEGAANTKQPLGNATNTKRKVFGETAQVNKKAKVALKAPSKTKQKKTTAKQQNKKTTQDTGICLKAFEEVITDVLPKLPKGVTDIDSHITDLFKCRDYVQEIIEYLQSREHLFALPHDFLTEDPEVTPHMRAILVDWLIQVQSHLNLMQQTMHLAVAMLDIFLSKNRIRLAKLQLLGITCLFVASKFEERFSPEVATLVNLTDNTYEYNDVIAMELVLLKSLGFNLSMPGPVPFLERYLAAVPADKQIEHLSRYLLDLIIHDVATCKFAPSMKAAASVHLSCRLLSTEPESKWLPNLCYYSKYSQKEMAPCMERMAKLLLRSEKSKFQGARSKYSSQSLYGSISQQPMLTSSPILYELLHLDKKLPQETNV